MSSRPPDVRIDDLLAPRFPEAVTAAFAAVAPAAEGLDWAPAALESAAAAAAGVDDFGDPLYREPLALLCETVPAEGNLSPMGLVSAHGQLVGFLRNKLLVEDLLARHPEIHDIEIVAPIVIAGLPRTGTTHLHNLVSADPALRSLPYWESLEPVPPLDEQGVAHDVDPRYVRCEAALAGLNGALPYFKRMHDMYPEHVHEEIQLLGIGLSTMLFETMAPMPTWRDRYLTTDQTPFYAYLKTILKVLQFLGGGERWVLKSPQHLEQFGPLLSVFPDATVVVTHRDPVSITASFSTMVTYSARMSARPEALRGVGTYWVDRIERMLQACVTDRDQLPADRSIDVLFAEFMADDIAMVRRIYEVADQPFTGASLAAMEAFMAEHPRGKHGAVRYDLADFGVDPVERREALRFYTDRFPVRLER